MMRFVLRRRTDDVSISMGAKDHLLETELAASIDEGFESSFRNRDLSSRSTGRKNE